MSRLTEDAQPTETPDLQGAFPRLSAAHIEMLAANGQRRRVQEGDILYREGDSTCDFFVILDGMVAIVEDRVLHGRRPSGGRCAVRSG